MFPALKITPLLLARNLQKEHTKGGSMNHVIRVALILVAVQLSSVIIPVCASETYSIQFSAADLTVTSQRGFDILSMKECMLDGEPGAPLLPKKRIDILIPPGKKCIKANVISKTIESLPGTFHILPAQPPLPLNGIPVNYKMSVNEEIYESESTYPKQCLKISQEARIAGNFITTVEITPLLYVPREHKVYIIRQITFELVLSNIDSEIIIPLHRTAFSQQFITETIRKRVINKGDVDERVAESQIVSFDQSSPSISEVHPEYNNSPRDLLIITDENLALPFEFYAANRTRRGIITSVVSNQWISRNYEGRDLAERIRNFIKDAYFLWGITWVLLGGDITTVPTRFAHYNSWEWNGGMPTDLYYSDLDGDWDSDGDGLFGEVCYGSNVDSVEGSPDVFVGRLPVETASEAYAYFERIATYEENVDTSYVPSVLFLGASIYSGGYDGWGAMASDDIINSYLPSHMQPYTMYAPKTDTMQSPPRWDADEELHRMATINQFNRGYNIINHLDHGAYDAFGTGVMSGGGYFHWHDADYMYNSERPSILWSISCHSNSFDLNAVSEHFVNSNGGIAYIGNSRLGWTSQLYQDFAFFKALFLDSITNIGAAHAATLYNSLYNQMSMNLLADPSLCIWTHTPEHLHIQWPKSIYVPADSIRIIAFKNGKPSANTRIVFTKPDEHITRIAITNTEGVAYISAGCAKPGITYLSAANTNCCPYFDSLDIFPSPIPYLFFEDSDYLYKAGSQHRIQIPVRNAGIESAEQVRLHAVSIDSNIILSDSLHKLGTIDPQTTVHSPPFRIRIDKNCPSSMVLLLVYELRDQKQHLWHDTVRIYTGSDSLAYRGHNPLILTADTMHLLYEEVVVPAISLKNLGDFQVHHVTAKLRTNNHGIRILDSIAEFESIPPGTLATSTDGFSYISRNASFVDFALEIGEGSGYFVTQSIDFDRPSKIDTIDFLSKQGSVKIFWKKPNSNDIMGYYIYKLHNDVWKRIQDDIIAKESYEDIDAIPGIPSSYYITAVDSSYNESEPSPIFTASCNPPMLPGWPAYVGPGGIAEYEGRRFYDRSSPAFGDIDGDGFDEVVVGSNDCCIYVYNHDGTRANGWPINTGFRITNSPAVCDLDHDGCEEIIVAGGVSDTISINIYHGDGSQFLPGKWPKKNLGEVFSSPIVSDIDNDGEYEIGMGYLYKVYFWNLDGSIVEGWPVDVIKPGCIAVSDIDNDLEKDIIIVNTSGQIHAYGCAGIQKPGWPQSPGGQIYAGLSLADLDEDGMVEIIVGTSSAKLYIYQYDGTIRSGWPVSVSEKIACIPAIGDVNGDHVLDVVISTRRNGLYAFAHTGALLLSMSEPYQANNYYISPILADLDNDNKDEIMISTLSGYIYAYDENQKYVPGFPLFIGDGSYSTPAIGDIDRNGTLNIILKGSDCRLYVWDLPTVRSYPEICWYKNSANNRNTCFYHEQEFNRGTTHIVDPSPLNMRAFFASPQPNPFCDDITLTFHIGKQAKSADLKIYDISGRLVKKFKIQTRYSLLPTELCWDGKSDNGRQIASGIYFAKLTVRTRGISRTFTRKLVRI
jgi:hypothetical protein